MNKRLLVLLALALLLFGLQTVWAQGAKQPAAGDEQMPRLSQAQQDKLADMRAQHQKAMIPLRSDLKVKQIELHELIRKEADQGAINKKIDEIGQVQIQIRKQRVAHLLEMRKLLTPEQREFLHSRPGMMMRHFRDRGTPGMGRGRRMMGDQPRWRSEAGMAPMWMNDDNDDDQGENMDMEWDDGFMGGYLMHSPGNCPAGPGCPMPCRKI